MPTSKERKKQQLEKRKALLAGRAEVLASLAKHSLPTAHLELIRSSASLGVTDTKRQRLARERQMRREAGGAASDDEVSDEEFTQPPSRPAAAAALGRRRRRAPR